MRSPLLLIASRNPGKVAEVNAFLADLDFELRDLSAFPDLPDVEETGASFAENALLKARFYHQRTGLLTVADDSGLEVDALGGEPGLRSARFAGPQATDADRIARLLQRLKEVPEERRSARFVCVVALVGSGGLEKTFTGICEGRIRPEPAGEHGFGYDPIFEYPPLGKTFAELTQEEKAAVSHRGRALQQLGEFLRQWKEYQKRSDEPLERG